MFICGPSQENQDKLSDLAYFASVKHLKKSFKMLQKSCFYVFSVQSCQTLK
jgi:hypothetical protein